MYNGNASTFAHIAPLPQQGLDQQSDLLWSLRQLVKLPPIAASGVSSKITRILKNY